MTESSSGFARWRLISAGVLALVVVGFGLCEATGWPFLAAPMQRWIGQTIARPVAFSEDPAAPPKVTIHLLGGVQVTAAYIMIGAPAWSNAPHMLLARDARMTLGYLDLWRARRGEPLRIRALRAAQLDGIVQRLADGRASWQFGKKSEAPDTAEQPTRLPEFGLLQVDAGSMVYRDALMAVDLDARFSLDDGTVAPASAASGFKLLASGAYRKLPMKVELRTTGVLPVIADDAAAVALPVKLDARVGGARLIFNGTATDALNFTALKGRFSVQGPSLADVGDPLRVTLPTTGPFRAEGLVAKEGAVWNVVTEQVSIGASRLAGAFTYDPRPRLPMLSGRLTGSRLQLADLGPAVGAPVRQSVAKAAPRGRVLPDRPFDLPALRAMDANVLIAIADVDLGSSLLEPLKPLRTHLVLADGVLTLRDLDARTGQGQLGGTVQLDGRDAQALWTADLRWAGVRLESWIHQSRADSAPPYATGSLNGQARVAGQGKSTAAILGSLRGGVRMQLIDGTISHLAVEAAGLDIAQGLGVLIKGDDALPIQCSVVDLVAEQGLLSPRVLVLDTPDSTLWVDGSMSLATEAMDLRVVATPKDFSPLALRSPLHIRGTFADPSISLDKGQLGARLGASALLGLINPLAALLPLIDVGSSADAKRGGEQCRALSDRIAARPVLPAPLPARRGVARGL
ncbi:MAG: AsmA family protein [Burkholderiales bacterium]